MKIELDVDDELLVEYRRLTKELDESKQACLKLNKDLEHESARLNEIKEQIHTLLKRAFAKVYAP